jgi:hypothetical protein
MVYVDELRQYPRTVKWRFGWACHLFADTVEELHEFAGALGLSRGWFQDKKTLPHYDLTKNRRAAAVKMGAVETTLREYFRRQGLTK